MNIRAAQPLILSGPIIVFGGPYSNLHALDALLAEAGRIEGAGDLRMWGHSEVRLRP